MLALTGAGIGGCASGAPVKPVAAPGVQVQGTSATTTDLAWAQVMAALDENLLRALEGASRRATDRGLAAAEVARSRTAELERLRTVLRDLGAPPGNPHEGHEMPGMATAAQLADLERSEGAAFDRLLAAILRAHAEQCVRLAEAELRSGTHPPTLALAAAVLESRRTERF